MFGTSRIDGAFSDVWETYFFMYVLTRAEGHLIGNHTYSHIQLTKNNRDKFKDELIKTNEILKEITGEEVQYVRPPYGSWDRSFEKELNMFPVLWTVDPLDWSSRNVGRITEKIVSKTGENDIILMQIGRAHV